MFQLKFDEEVCKYQAAAPYSGRPLQTPPGWRTASRGELALVSCAMLEHSSLLISIHQGIWGFFFPKQPLLYSETITKPEDLKQRNQSRGYAKIKENSTKANMINPVPEMQHSPSHSPVSPKQMSSRSSRFRKATSPPNLPSR